MEENPWREQRIQDTKSPYLDTGVSRKTKKMEKQGTNYDHKWTRTEHASYTSLDIHTIYHILNWHPKKRQRVERKSKVSWSELLFFKKVMESIFEDFLWGTSFNSFSIEVSLNSWILWSFRRSSSYLFLTCVDWVLLIMSLDKIRCLQDTTSLVNGEQR